MPTLHHCGTPLVTTLDALSRPRERCPACDRVAPPSRLAPILQATSQAKWAPPAPTAPPRRRIFVEPDLVVAARPKAARREPAPRMPDRREGPGLEAAPVHVWKAARRDAEARTKAVASPRRRAPDTRPRARMVFRPKLCARCGREFTPRGGRQVNCDRCGKPAA